MAKRADVPEFGMLRGVTVVNASTVVAGPIAASLMAEMGADVIWIESTKSPDTNRGKGGMGAECDRKNMRNISLDIPSPEGREILKKLLTNADIFIESSKGGTILEAKVKELCDTHDAIEVENILCGMGVPCSRVMTYEMMETQPHYVARHTIKEWDAVDGRHLKGVALVPAVTNNPGQIWRGCPTIGMDNEDILSDLGYDKAEIAKLYESGVIRKV